MLALLSLACEPQILLQAAPVVQTSIYSNDFEAAIWVKGDNTLAGVDQWVVSPAGQLVYGIESGLVPGLGKFGFIGFNAPTGTSANATLFAAFRPTPFNPGSMPVVRYSAILGFVKSTNTYTPYLTPIPLNDIFRVWFYNNGVTNNGVNRQPLASLDFHTSTGYIFRGDGTNISYDPVNSPNKTGVAITYDEALELVVYINYETNRWTASLGGSPLWVDEVFRSTSLAATRPLSLGMVLFQWSITTAGHAGNNWMLFDELNLTAEPLGQLELTKLETVSNKIKLTWPTEEGYSYRVQYSTNLSTWFKDLTGSLFRADTSLTNQTYTDAAAISGKRFYRISRWLNDTAEP